MNWDAQTEVLVLGYGGAGAVAAITAHDAGAEVLLLEKMEKGGGVTKISLGGFLCLKDLDRGLSYLESLIFRVSQVADPEMVRIYARECFQNREWLEKEGARTQAYGGAAFPQLPGSEAIEKRMLVGPPASGENSFWTFLRSQVERRKIPVWNHSPARALITDAAGAVTGAWISREGQDLAVKARRAVILTCGGFEFNDWMKMNYLKGYPYYSLASPGNTGDGIRMAQRVGADLWHVSAVSATLGFKAPEFEAAFMVRPAMSRYILVDQGARRFASEFADVHAYNFLVDSFDLPTLTYRRIPCYMIFDETGRSSGPLCTSAVGYNRNLYSWSRDNGEEIHRGWITVDETLAGLARKVNFDPGALEKTVRLYNECCEIGRDQEFQRPPEKLAPLGPGPYCSMKLFPCLLNTQGGPRRNGRAQVLYPDGRPIPRLYSAGEMGSLFGLLYQGGGNLGECLASGRIGGAEAARETPQ